MDDQRVPSTVGFEDSSLLEYGRTDDTLVVRARAWNHSVLLVTFDGVIGVRHLGAWELSALVRRADHEGVFFVEALRRHFEMVPESHSYRWYAFLDSDASTSLEVVASNVHVSVVES